MRRREFVAGLGGAAAWSRVGRAQQPAMPAIGVLHSWLFMVLPFSCPAADVSCGMAQMPTGAEIS